ncbi:MAG: S-adenosylmethionine:tRNA ribosyltransferase-isomerase [Planctomycetota bacterium]|nr:MAG: S-adenosylmethionine:tRNA ribosyltransferase-isomerase [Planctomycetota bacterium]
MRLEDLDYELPREAIAQQPVEPRDASRLMVVPRGGGAAAHRRFRDLPELLRPGDLLVLNDTRVLPARLQGVRLPGGGRVECLLVRERAPGLWEAMVRPGRRVREGVRLVLAGGELRCEVRARLSGGLRLLAFGDGADLGPRLEQLGQMPLPPYIDRRAAPPEVHRRDRERYQTVFARNPGAVAAPTAGLHFTTELLGRLEAAGIELAWVTLHVGPGTFLPITTPDPRAHPMHSERYACPPVTLQALRRTRAAGGRIVACGTTVVRVLESIAAGAPPAGETQLYICPPYRFAAIDALITNFHLPRSTLLLLVAALLEGGLERLKALYAEALAAGYRFYSYGDAMLII